jgi:hypothetical protein
VSVLAIFESGVGAGDSWAPDLWFDVRCEDLRPRAAGAESDDVKAVPLSEGAAEGDFGLGGDEGGPSVSVEVAAGM